MRDRHLRRCPEDTQPAEINRMAHDPIHAWRPEFQAGVFPPDKMQVHLAQSEKVEVVDEECSQQQQDPSCGIEQVDEHLTEFVFDLPDYSTDWLPLPEQQD